MILNFEKVITEEERKRGQSAFLPRRVRGLRPGVDRIYFPNWIGLEK